MHEGVGTSGRRPFAQAVRTSERKAVRTQRVAITLAAIALAGSATMPTIAQADATSSTFYVDNATSASCSDSTTDSSTTPYCTIQAAVDAATSPGDTVIVSSGTYAPFTVTSSGTAAAPITIEGAENIYAAVSASSGGARVTAAAAEDKPAVSLSGASYVTLDNFSLDELANQSVISITASSNITVNSAEEVLEYGSAIPTVPIVSIAGQSSAVILSRNEMRGYTTGDAILADGGSADTITTNEVTGAFDSSGIVLDDVTDANVTSNTQEAACGDGIDVTNGSTSATIENNYVTSLEWGEDTCSATAQTSGAALAVDGTSTTGTTADYNSLSTGTTYLPNVYSWAGKAYTSTAAFTEATGQGAHDSDQIINSANSDAPGELATDMHGEPRVDDPEVASTGAGTYDDYDRGALQTEDPITLANAVDWPSKAPAGATGTFTTTATDPWGYTVTGCTYDFGDGTAPVTVSPSAAGTCSAQHAYATTGGYRITLTMSLSDGFDYINRANDVSVVTASAFTPEMTATADGSLGVTVNATTGTDDWSIAYCSVDFGDGSASVVSDSCFLDYTYKTPGTYTITVTVVDAGGNHAVAPSQSYSTTGSFYTPVTPVRVLDTRKAIGVSTDTPVAADGVVKLKIAGVQGLPATGVTAVALNVTATDATKLGYIVAYPDGGARPDVSNVDFGANQNVANTVIVEVGSDGYVDLANQSSGTTDILADLQGYYSLDGTSGYNSVTQTRLLDTRRTAAVPAGSTVKLYLGASYPGITAAMLNVTAVDATGNGYLTAYPDGGSVPGTSNVNYLAGEVVPNEVVVQVGSDGDVDLANHGAGEVNILVDLSGYFTAGAGEAFTPLTPLRYLDTRDGVGVVVGSSAPSEAEPDQTTDLEVADVCPSSNCANEELLPADAAAIAGNVTVVSPTAIGYITVYPGGVSSAPITSVLNFTAGQQTQNAVTVGLGSARGDFNLLNGSKGDTQLIVDVFGYYGG